MQGEAGVPEDASPGIRLPFPVPSFCLCFVLFLNHGNTEQEATL